MRIPWDKYETAILIDACIQIINNKTDKNTAIQSISAKLRKRAVNTGILIDNVFRNENGIKMQMAIIMSMIHDEEPGLYNELYRSKYSEFSAILKEANLQAAGISEQKPTFEKLHISECEVDAIFFNKPDEVYGFLSNRFYSPFDINNMHYTSAEQYIIHQKCLLFGDEESAKAVLATDHPDKQQIIGRQIKRYVNSIWAGSRQLITVRGLIAKFDQNEELQSKLFKTKESYLVCAHSDTTWACGKRLNEPDRLDASKWTGQNILGFSLMEVRNELSLRSAISIPESK